jgi:hypothetical protein
MLKARKKRMTTSGANTVPYALHQQVDVAFKKIIASGKPTILNWDGQYIACTILDEKRTASLIKQANCLGLYEFGATRVQILCDLLVVIEQKDL